MNPAAAGNYQLCAGHPLVWPISVQCRVVWLLIRAHCNPPHAFLDNTVYSCIRAAVHQKLQVAEIIDLVRVFHFGLWIARKPASLP
jgi:hypothetical protein